uniref:Large ribosomal subunit protein uL14 n=1 Tax=Spermophilus dauricus TaxID=99837 RepID=A0A8C9QB02_SPEDA
MVMTLATKPELRKKIHPAVVIQQQKLYKRKDSMVLYPEDNTGVIVNNKDQMKGSAISRQDAKECADSWPRRASNASSIG